VSGGAGPAGDPHAEAPATPSAPLSSDRELLRRLHEEGDLAAREELVQRHLPLVRALARRYAGRGEPLDDIEQVGAIGLLKAIDRYELSREVALTTYATPNVVGEIKRHFRDKGWAIRIPRGMQELNARMSTTIERLTGRLGRSPTIGEIARELSVNSEQVLEALEAGSAYAPMSLSSTPTSEGELDPMEAIGTEDQALERTEQRATLEPALRTLSERDREILRKRFEEGLTQTQIAEQVGISQMHVSRLIRKSLARMRAELSER
jgi:RNA polymerase sigma-B factor